MLLLSWLLLSAKVSAKACYDYSTGQAFGEQYCSAAVKRAGKLLGSRS